MTNEVVKFLKKIAADEGFLVLDSMFGKIQLGQEFPIKQSSGAVYGIWVHDAVPPKNNLSEMPGNAGWYPVYWGKDVSPVSRIKAHVQGHKNNGNANLPSVKEIQGKSLIFGAILVARYDEFEAMLHRRHPPLKGTASKGRAHQVIQVES